MTNLPPQFLTSMEGMPGYDRQAFEAVHQAGRQVTAIRLNPAKPLPPVGNPQLSNQPLQAVPWGSHGFYLPNRPSFTTDPALHAGAYYVQEASSMFVEQALRQTLDLSQPLKILDLCAAPGGKSTHIQSLISPSSVLVSNEVIKPRVNILMENLVKWGAANVMVTNNDPADFTRLDGIFDAIVVDAPCSGSGLWRKDPQAVAEWSEANVQLCGQRQHRILADVWPALKPGGILIYSTCSYSAEEDEQVADWLTEELGAASLPLTTDANWGIVETTSPKHQNKGYRFYPYKLDGEGFYLACFQKGEGHEAYFLEKTTKYQPDKKLLAASAQWLHPAADLQLYQHEAQVFGMPPATWALFSFLQKNLNIRKAGIKLGDWARDQIIPDHALALYPLANPSIPTMELSLHQALQYLRKADFSLDDLPKGWVLLTYLGLSLGWVKSMPGRFNNYYPKEWRIRNL